MVRKGENHSNIGLITRTDPQMCENSRQMIGQRFVDFAVSRNTLVGVADRHAVAGALGDRRALARAGRAHNDDGQLGVVLLLVLPPVRVLAVILPAQVSRELPQGNHDREIESESSKCVQCSWRRRRLEMSRAGEISSFTNVRIVLKSSRKYLFHVARNSSCAFVQNSFLHDELVLRAVLYVNRIHFSPVLHEKSPCRFTALMLTERNEI